ncbi:unnamed protein product [Rotaria sordida]|uniref:Uncharacterized protein n=1 Tax=Rotaria sordida TaxID=392033 RepID=A0A818VU81_9BILA|nr:unnamed protein product [Rotaria sordida]
MFFFCYWKTNINRITLFSIVNTSQAGQGQLKVELIQPQNSKIPCRCHVQEIKSNEYLIQYIPIEPGRFQLRILFNNQLVQGKTFDTDVYLSLPQTSKTNTLSSITHIQQIIPNNIPEIGDHICLQINTENPSISSIQSQILYNGLSVPHKIERTIDLNIWHLKFRPYVPGSYKINLIHNGLSLITSPYIIQVKDTSGKVVLSGLEQTLLTNSPCVIQVHAESASNAQIRVIVLLGNRQIPSTTTIINDNLVRIHFIPQEPGIYTIHVSCANQPIEGSPFSIRVERPRSIQISGECFHRLRLNDLGLFRIHCHGQRGLIQAKIFNLSAGERYDIGQTISFQLQDTYEQLIQFPAQILLTSFNILLATRLKLTQERIRNVALNKENGRATVSFQLYETPTQTTTNEQVIQHLRHLINNQILNLLDLNRCILNTIIGSVVVGPKGEPVNVKLFPQASGDYTGEFTPTKIGQHRIDITFANTPIQGSPFFTEVYDPSQVRIGPLPRDIIVNTENTFEINLDNAGNVPLEIKISSPTGLNVPFKIDDASFRSTVKKVRFTPNETGVHYLNAKFGSEIIPGTPIKMMVNDARLVTAYGDGIHHALHEKLATFMIDTQDMQGDLKVRIEGSNSVIKNTLERTNDNRFKVTYVPVEVGFVTISIKWNGKDITNSPFKAAVTNPERVRIVGGWQSILDSEDRMHVIINEEKKIRFDTSHAGPGTLKADIRGSNDGLRVPIRIDQQGAIYTLSFTVIREGKYDVTITYDQNPLPNMPIRAIANSTSTNLGEHLKVEVRGHGSYEAKVNEEAEFTIDASKTSAQSTSMPIVRLTGVQADVEVRIRQIENNIFLCSYVPTAPGAYLLSVTWAERQVRGSPFKVNVLPNTNVGHSASRVICSGEGLRMGILGKEIKCIIDTRGAGPGELTAYCQGVNKTAFCRLFDHRDGTFTLFIKPQESGRHVLTIKYNDEDVPGSPYTLKVSGPPDANKVRVSGPGIEHGVLSTFQSHFICETKGAGAGQLTVKIRGPKGAFRVEMQREHLQDRTIICRYNPTEPGDYLISVKWSDEHVYGSPFHTHIFERQEELERFLHEQNAYRQAQKQWREEV